MQAHGLVRVAQGTADQVGLGEFADALQAAIAIETVVERRRGEVDEFLFQLSRGHRDDNILQDALSRLDDDSSTVKAVVQLFSGAIDETGFDAAVNLNKSQSERCSVADSNASSAARESVGRDKASASRPVGLPSINSI